MATPLVGAQGLPSAERRRVSIVSILEDTPVDPVSSRETQGTPMPTTPTPLSASVTQSRMSSREMRFRSFVDETPVASRVQSRANSRDAQSFSRATLRELLRMPPVVRHRSSDLPSIRRKSRHISPKPRKSRRQLPTARVERIAMDSLFVDDEEEQPRPPAIMDLVLVLPVGPQPGDEELLPQPGEDSCEPVPGSAAWYLQQIIADDEIFTATSKRERLRGENAINNDDDDSAPQFFRPSTLEEDPLMKLCYQEALQEAETKGQLREHVIELLLRYLMSTKCCFQVKAFLSADGHHLFLGVYAEELVLRGHADLLGYDVAFDETVACGLLRGAFKPGEVLPAHVRYNIEEEQQFRRLHDSSPFKTYPGSFAEQQEGNACESGCSLFRAIDRMRLVEMVISKVFNLEDLVEHGFLAARYSCHSVPRQRHLAKVWATPLLLHSPSVPLGEIRDYLGEAMTFRVCFLSFLTRMLMPVAAIAAIAGLVPRGALPATLLCVVLALWTAYFRVFWSWTEEYWAIAWGMDGFKSTEATRPKYQGAWGLWQVDRYTIIKVSSAPRQLLRRTLTGLATVLFNAALLASVVGLMAYRRSLVVSGHQNRAHLVSYLNAAQMLLLDTVWGYAALSLTDFDNYRRDSDYTEKVIWRIFTARFINSFACLFYVALLKHSLEGCEDGYGCHSELRFQLRVMFGTSMARSVLRAAFSYAWFRVSHWLKLLRARPRQSGYNVLGSKEQQSSIEVQASMPEFSLSEDVEDSMDLMIEFGFVLYFGSVAPEIVWLFCASNLIRLRAWGWKLLFAVRRPFPKQGSGLGTLNTVVAFMSVGAVWFNILSCVMLNVEAPKAPSEKDVFARLKQLMSSDDEQPADTFLGDWKLILLFFLVLERAVAVAWWLVTLPFPAKWRLVQLAEQRRHEMVKAYYKVLVQGAVAPYKEEQEPREATVEALVPVDQERSQDGPREWKPVVLERIIRACREVPVEVSPWTPRDPGFEPPWDSDEPALYTVRAAQVTRDDDLENGTGPL